MLHTGAVQSQRHSILRLCKIRESVAAPLHRHQVCLSTESLKASGTGTASEKHTPPFTFRSHHKVGMSGAGDRICTCVLEIALRKSRIAAPARKLSAQAVGTIDNRRMMIAGAALRTYQEVTAVNLVDMRTLVAVEMLFRTHSGLGKWPRIAYGLPRFRVKGDKPDATVVAPLRTP